MTTSKESLHDLMLEVACRHDVPGILALARAELPRLTSLHDEGGWRDHYRFGAGQHIRDNLFLVARWEPNAPPVAFCWVDAACWVDAGIEEPWWCINALAVPPELRRQGVGRQLVNFVQRQATEVGIVSLYGLCYPDVVGFWKSVGFAVSERGRGIVADRKVRLRDRGVVTLAPIRDTEGDHAFVMSRSDTDDAARLALE